MEEAHRRAQGKQPLSPTEEQRAEVSASPVFHPAGHPVEGSKILSVAVIIHTNQTYKEEILEQSTVLHSKKTISQNPHF